MSELDVRRLPAREKHPTILRLLDELPVGGALRVVNDHDPVPLQTLLQRLGGDAFGWEYVQQGPDEWRVDIRKTAAVAAPLVGTERLPRILPPK